MYKAKFSIVSVDGIGMEYVEFGRGNRTLIILPGLGDGLRTMKGLAGSLSWMYRIFAKQYRVYIFSRKSQLVDGCTSKDMACDLKKAMDQLGVSQADILGVSQGGTVAQHLAAAYPDSVGKLVLAVTYPKTNNTVRERVNSWIAMAETGDYKSIFIDTTEHSYSDAMLKKYRPLYPVLSRIGKPASFDRFIAMAKACVTHDAADRLNDIAAPTLIIGGDCDKIVGTDAAHELAAGIKNSRLHIYNGLGHGLYDEAKDFNRVIFDFLQA